MDRGKHIVVFSLFIVTLWLNFAAIIQIFVGTSDAINLWVIVPILMVLIYLPQSLFRGDISSAVFLVGLFALVLLLNGLRNFLSVGVSGFAWAFLSYGLWLGLFLWSQRQSPQFLLRLIVGLFLFSGLVHAVVALAELIYGQAFLKFVTIGASVERRYGISFSLAVLGLQLGCGALASLAQLRLCRTTTAKIFVVFCFYIIVMALYVTAIRAPLIYLVFGVMGVALFRYCSSVQGIVSVMLIAILLVFSALALDGMGKTDLSFVGAALELSDQGNIGRLDRYSISLDLLLEEWWVPFMGYGAAMLTQIPVAMGAADFGAESSVLKAILELGALGLLPAMIHMSVISTRLLGRGGWAIIKANLEAFVIMAFIALECLTSEVFKTWIGSFWTVLALSLITRLTLYSPAVHGDER